MDAKQIVNLVFSNLNSCPRESLSGMTPYDKFIAEHGQDRWKKMSSLFKISDNQMLLDGKNPTAQIQSSKTYRQSDGLLLESQFTFGRDE